MDENYTQRSKRQARVEFADVNETLHEEELEDPGVSAHIGYQQRGQDSISYEDFHTMVLQTNFPMDTSLNPDVYKKAIEYLRNGFIKGKNAHIHPVSVQERGQS